MLRFVLNRCVEDGDEGSFPTLGRLTDLLTNDDDVVGTSPADENIANNNTNNNNSSTEALPQIPSASTEEKAVDTAKKKAATSSSMLAFMLEHCLDADEEARIVFPSLMRLERMMQDDELSHLPPPPPPPQTNAPTTTTTTTTQSLSTEEAPMAVAVPTLVSASMPPMAAPRESKMEENILTQHDAQQTAASMLEVPPPPPHGDVSASTRLSSKSSPQHSSRGQLTTGDLVAQTCGGVRPTGCATLGQLALMPASNPLMPAEEAEVLEEPTTTTSSEAAAKVHLQLLPSVVDGETSDSAEEDAVEQLYRHHPTEPPYEEGASRSSIYTASDFSSALPRSCASSTTQAPAQTPPSTKVRAAAAVARSRSTTNNKKDRPPVAQKQQQQQQQPTGSWLVGGAPPRTTAAAALSRRGRTVREEVHRATCLRALDLANTYKVPLSRKFVGAGRNGVDRPNYADRFHQRLYEREVVEEESAAHTHNGVEEPARRRSVDPLTRYYGRTILEFNLAEYERGVRRARGRCPPSVVGHDAQTISPEHMTNGNGSQTSAEPLMSVRDHAHPHPSRSTSTPRPHPHGKGRSRSPRQRGGNRRADASLERMMVVGHNMGPTSLYPRRAIPH